MSENNTKLGFYYSAALHITVAVAAVVAVFLSIKFPKEKKEPTVFEMVAPPPPSVQQEDNTPAPEEPVIEQPDVQEINPINIPDPSPPEPETPTPPEPTPPEPAPKPTPTPAPKPAPKPKPSPEPKPQPQKVSYKDFIKENPKKAKPAAAKPTTAKPVKIDKIKGSTSNIANIANISVKGTQSAVMKNLLSSYVAEIHEKAKRNWVQPTSALGMQYSAKVQFTVSKNGAISGIRIIASSGDADFDKSVMAALSNLSLSAPPDNEQHTVTITFEQD